MISVNLIGRLTREPELRHVPDPSMGGELEVCQVRVAARDRRGDTVFLDLNEWGASGRAAAAHLHQGSMVGFTGSCDSARHRATAARASSFPRWGTSSSLTSGGRLGNQPTTRRLPLQKRRTSLSDATWPGSRCQMGCDLGPRSLRVYVATAPRAKRH